MNEPTQPTKLSVKLELYITEPELQFLAAVCRELNKRENPREVIIQDVIRALIRARMRDDEEAA